MSDKPKPSWLTYAAGPAFMILLFGIWLIIAALTERCLPPLP